jgi:hypothetical protein
MAFFPPQDTQDVSGIPANDAMAQLDLQRRLRMAQALQESKTPEGQMVSGHYVAPSWTQSLASAYNKYRGGRAEEEAMKQYGDYAKSKEDKMAQALTKLGGAFEPKTVTNTTMQAQDVPLSQGMNVPTSPFGTSDQVSQVAPQFNANTPAPQNIAGTTTQMNPVTSTSTTQPTLSDIEKAFGQYASDVKDPKMLASILTNRYEKMVKAQEPVKLGAGESVFSSTGTKMFGNPKESAKYTNIQQDKAGNSFGLNTETNQFEQLPGAKMATENWSQPYKVGNEFLQRNSSTGEIRKAYESGDKQTFTQTTELRNDFNNLPQVKAWNVVEPALVSARVAANDTSGASDLNLIYAVGKVLDPNSVVREGELQLASDTGSFGQKLLGINKSILQGGKLTPAIKQDLLRQIESRTYSQKQQYNAAKTKYSDIAKKNNLDPNDLFISTIVEPLDVTKKPISSVDAEKQQAMEWIQANPNDPRTPQIKQRLGL